MINHGLPKTVLSQLSVNRTSAHYKKKSHGVKCSTSCECQNSLPVLLRKNKLLVETLTLQHEISTCFSKQNRQNIEDP